MLMRGDARSLPLRDGCVNCAVTSPPYFGLRDYGTAAWNGGDEQCNHVGTVERLAPPGTAKQRSNRGTVLVRSGDCACGATRIDKQLGLESSPGAYVAALVAVFREVRRVLKPEGTVWCNLGDSYYSTGQGGGTGSASAYRGKAYLSDGVRHNTRYQPDVKPKDLLGIPWRVAFALQADGWYLRSDIIWSKPNPMPESVTDRPTKAHEYLFLLTKSERYYFDAQAIVESVSEAMRYETEQGYEGLGLKDYEAAGVQNPSSVKARIIANARKKQDGYGRRHAGFNQRWADQPDMRNDAERQNSLDGRGFPRDGMTRNKRTVWTIATMPYAGAHFATMPEALVKPCILAGCPLNGLVLDPFVGSGTVVAVAERLGRRGVGVDLSYQHLATKRTAQRGLRFGAATA